MSTLREAPYSLALGELIQVTVEATNDKGTSDPSSVNIVGAVVQYVPQVAPVPSRGSLTDAENIELTWTELASGIDRGYAAVTGYRIYWDDSGDYQLRISLNSASITSYFEASVTQGTPYNFKISAVNVYGEGVLSDPI